MDRPRELFRAGPVEEVINMSKITVLLCSLLLVFGNISYADDAGAPLKDKKAAKIAVLSMTTYKVLLSGDGFGAAKSMGDTAKAGDEKKEGDAKEEGDGGDFAVVNTAVFDNITKELSGFRDWKFTSAAADDANKDALAAFKTNLEAALKQLSGGDSINLNRYQTVPGLPYVPTQAAVAMLNKDYKKALGEAIAQYCKDAGVDGVWIQEIYPGYGTTGGSAFFSKLTMGSGQAVAKVMFIYGLYDSGGNLILDESGEEHKSDDSFAMAFGIAKFDKNMEKLLIQAIEIGAKNTAKRLNKKL